MGATRDERALSDEDAFTRYVLPEVEVLLRVALSRTRNAADAVARLPTRFRHVLELVDIDGLSYQEAADALGVPVGTVMSRLHRARHRIRTRLTAAGLVPRSKR